MKAISGIAGRIHAVLADNECNGWFQNAVRGEQECVRLTVGALEGAIHDLLDRRLAFELQTNFRYAEPIPQ